VINISRKNEKHTLYNASRHVKKAPWPKRGKSATALKTKSLLHAIIGIWVAILEEFGVTFGFPWVKRISVIICNDVSQWMGSPKSTIAINNQLLFFLIQKTSKKKNLPSIVRKSLLCTSPCVLINSLYE
jgi:hypothetical protein